MFTRRQAAVALHRNARTQPSDPDTSHEPPTPTMVFLRLAATLAIGLAVALLGNAYASFAMH